MVTAPNPTRYPWYELVEKENKTDDEKRLVVAVIILSTHPHFAHSTMEQVYEQLLDEHAKYQPHLEPHKPRFTRSEHNAPIPRSR